MSRVVFAAFITIIVSAGVLAACGDASDPGSLHGNNGGAGGEPGAVPSGPSAGPPTGDTGNGGGNANGSTTSGGPAPAPAAPANAGIPCNVRTVLDAKCVSCHASTPINGSLSPLVTAADLLAPSKEEPTKNVAQVSLSRMQNAASPMPPTSYGNPPTAGEISAFQAWINGNYQGACANAPPPPAAPDPFKGGAAFVAQTAGSTHNTGRNCMSSCHDHGFTFAGTVTNGAGQGVAGAEVRLVDANGKAILVHTGPQGSFRSSTSWVAPAIVGVRTATEKATMVTTLKTSANGGCNGCHAAGGTQVAIHVP